jgi:hypothetical protein
MIFAKLCESIQKDTVTPFQNTEVRWLSKGKILSTIFLLREELQLFFEENNKERVPNFLAGAKSLQKLAYLVDIYQHLNTLNTSMQGPKDFNLHRQTSWIQE